MQNSQHFLLLLFMFSVSSLQAQRKFKQHFSYSLFYEQNRSFRFLIDNNDPVQKDWFEERKATEKAITTAKFGGNIYYHFSEKWAIKTGFSFARYGRLDEPTYIHLSTLIVDTTVMTQTPSYIHDLVPILNEENIKYKRKFAYFEVPISAHYSTNNSKILSFFEFGFIATKSRFSQTTTISKDEETTDRYNYASSRKFNLGLELVAGFKLAKFNQMTISLLPSFSVYFLNRQRYGLSEKLYAYGLRLQIDFFSKR